MPRGRGRSGIEISGQRELRELIRDLNQYADGKQVKKRLRRQLKETSSAVVPAVRAAVKRIPSKGENARRGRPSLRSRLSAAAQMRIRISKASVAITALMNPAKMPDGQGGLPAYMEGTQPRWRHPLFGNTDYHYDQSPHPYFFPAVAPFGSQVEEAVINVADEIRKDLGS